MERACELENISGWQATIHDDKSFEQFMDLVKMIGNVENSTDSKIKVPNREAMAKCLNGHSEKEEDRFKER
jgi:hypothetical protein